MRVTDRGPYVEERDFDLSMVGFKILATEGLRVGVERTSLHCRVTGYDTTVCCGIGIKP